ncbi:hypothetical protein [Aeromonas salmonicida]|uniref:hypothetical protein n=1 Tax=Aeromonas salmonicida TaxID=645 RepID=UPI003F7C6365
MRSFLKNDDGWLDLIVKLVTIATFAFAVHQYIYKIFPVWSKEKELQDVSYELENKKNDLNSVSIDLSKATENLKEKEQQVENANSRLKFVEEEKIRKEQELEGRIQALTNEADKLKQEYLAEKIRIATELKVARKTIETKNSQMVGVYLESFSNEIFSIQIDNIRWSKGEEKLDLRRDIIKYADEKLASETDPIKKTALAIFKIYAEKKLKSGQKEYSQALMVGFFYQSDQEAKAMIAKLTNV